MPSHSRTTIGVILAVAIALAVSACASIAPPLTGPQVAGFAARLGDELTGPPEPIKGILTVEDAVARAIRHNRTIRTKELEAALAEARVRSQSSAMLPSLVAESNYYRRDRPPMAHSNLTPAYSTSSDLGIVSREMALSWNILDFGLSYVRAKQGLDKAQQQHEEALRVSARIVEETRSLYWRAVALERLEPALVRLNRELDEALRLSRTASLDPRVDPMVPINYQREALNLQREINQLRTSLAGSTDQLKQTIGLPPAAPLRLERKQDLAGIVQPTSAAADDIAAALRQRPEIRQVMYDMRIALDEVDAAILQLLPGVTFNRTISSDSNSYLLYDNWISWGGKVAGNVINLVRLPAEIEYVEAQQHVHRQNALAIAATIVMQVHVARARVGVHLRAYRDAKRFAEIQHDLLHQVTTSVNLGKVAQQALVREKLATLLAEIRALLAYAELSAAHAAYLSAKGEERPATSAPGRDPSSEVRQ